MSNECPNVVSEGNATTTETSYIIEPLREGTTYTFTVSASNLAGTSAPSNPVAGKTKETHKWPF